MKISKGPWKCDVCSRLIRNADDGYVRIITTPGRNKKVGISLALIHNPMLKLPKCQFFKAREHKTWPRGKEIEVQMVQISYTRWRAGFNLISNLAMSKTFSKKAVEDLIQRLRG
jgi:hypothetical protein